MTTAGAVARTHRQRRAVSPAPLPAFGTDKGADAGRIGASP